MPLSPSLQALISVQPMSSPIFTDQCLFMGTIHFSLHFIWVGVVASLNEPEVADRWREGCWAPGWKWVTLHYGGLIVTHPLRMMMMTSHTRHFNGERTNSAPSQARACCLLASYPHSGKAFVCHSNAAQLWILQSVVRDVNIEVAAPLWLPHQKATGVSNA